MDRAKLARSVNAGFFGYKKVERVFCGKPVLLPFFSCINVTAPGKRGLISMTLLQPEIRLLTNGIIFPLRNAMQK